MPTDAFPGRALATRRAAADLVRAAVLGSYGVAGLEASLWERIRAFLVGRTPGIRVALDGDRVSVTIHLRVATGLPVAEVARQVDSAVRYALKRGLGRETEQLRIRIVGLEARRVDGPPPPTKPRAGAGGGSGLADLADSGADVA